MATTSSASIEYLPVEIVHRIFDHLDAQTILFFVRPVCRLFRSIVHSYDRYKFDFPMISKCSFHRLCRLIPPQRLISLTLYQNEQISDQISFFILNYRLRQLTRLRSLNLLGVDECHLNFILKRINLDRLTSFSLHIREYDGRREKTTAQYLSSIMAQPTLRKVELDVRKYRLSSILWPMKSQIKMLILNAYISPDNLFQIINSSPQLHTLIIKEDIAFTRETLNEKSALSQITSLTLERFNGSIDLLELFLSLTPSLTYLKLIDHVSEFDGQRWEQFIQGNLPHLSKFKFFTSFSRLTDQTCENLKFILQEFQSPFWIEHKKWFVACEFRLDAPRTIQIYSIPICKTILNENLNSKICFLSTSNHLLNLEDINEVNLRLEKPFNNNLLKIIDTPFPNVTKLRLDFRRTISTHTINHLQSIFNLSQLIEVHLESSTFDETNKDYLCNIIKLIDQSSKLTSLTIHSHYGKSWIYPYLNDLCSILPRQIKYLQMPIYKVEQMEMIFERCRDLSIVKFETIRGKCSMDVTEWFDENTIDSMFRRQNGFSHVWIGKKMHPISDNRKRIKLVHNQSN